VSATEKSKQERSASSRPPVAGRLIDYSRLFAGIQPLLKNWDESSFP
jgi:hypothetical protein